MATNKTGIRTQQKAYRPCVGIALFNCEGKIFVGERIDTPGAWQMPQGGIDPGEEIETAALREIKEEIGTDKTRIIRIADRAIRYDLPEEIAEKIWDGNYSGQEQTWVALRFTGQDEDINLDSFDTPEFTAWKWVSPEELLDLIVPFKRDVYMQVVEIFGNIKPTD